MACVCVCIYTKEKEEYIITIEKITVVRGDLCGLDHRDLVGSLGGPSAAVGVRAPG